ncbi:MAG: MATE family efflux transporter [Clostridia bacterium]|nr:MATE family efflux transporter [Clostridia bacterium]
MQKVLKSLKNVNLRLFASLLVLGLCPTIYTTLRVFFIGQLPGEWSYSIAGQLSWVNLLYEVLSEAIILPLYFFIGQVKEDKKEFTNRVKTGLLVSFGLYTVLSVVIVIFAEGLLRFMAADASIIEESAQYIRIESIANVCGLLFSFMLVVLVTLGKDKYVYILTGAKLVLCVLFDTFMTSTLPVSLNLGINGIAYTNIIVNLLLFVVTFFLLYKEDVKIFSKDRLSFVWFKKFLKIGGISGVESLVRNVAYMMMISRMVNMVGEQGTYWVANNFIWGWLLLPVIQLGEVIKSEVGKDQESVRRNTLGYFGITVATCLLWCASIPVWKPFMKYVLGYSDVDKLFTLVMVLLGFYMLYALQNVFDSTFYGLGKTNYMLFESLVTNTVFYGGAFILYLTGAWTPSLIGIALLFGIGNVFDSIVSLAAYVYLLKKRKINLLLVEE